MNVVNFQSDMKQWQRLTVASIKVSIFSLSLSLSLSRQQQRLCPADDFVTQSQINNL